MHALADVHDTAVRWLAMAAAGTGTFLIAHRTPFQRSDSGTEEATVSLSAENPAAMHALAEAHETPLKELKTNPAGLRMRWLAHLRPFQRSATTSEASPSRLDERPTALQALAEAHDIPLREVKPSPAGSGMRWMAHLRPFQRSASGMAAMSPFTEDPTAMHFRADAHEIPVRVLSSDARPRMRWMAHRRPFQRSASGIGEPLVISPTAMHFRADGHETPVSTLPSALAGMRARWMAHLRPFQRSASGTRVSASSMYPTAVHALADVHDTPVSAPDLTPAGRRARRTVQAWPFQRSASGTSAPARLTDLPTATHFLAAAQDTPASESCWTGAFVLGAISPAGAADTAAGNRTSAATAVSPIVPAAIRRRASRGDSGGNPSPAVRATAAGQFASTLVIAIPALR
jgi:hypothetical protein